MPKAGGTKVRILSIPTIRDRVGQGAFKLDEIGDTIDSFAALSQKLDDLDLTPGNVTFTMSGDVPTFDVNVVKRLSGTADLDLLPTGGAFAGTLGGSYIDRQIPASGLLNQVEQSFDQHLRDVDAARPWEREASRIPGLAPGDFVFNTNGWSEYGLMGEGVARPGYMVPRRLDPAQGRISQAVGTGHATHTLSYARRARRAGKYRNDANITRLTRWLEGARACITPSAANPSAPPSSDRTTTICEAVRVPSAFSSMVSFRRSNTA